MSQMVNNPPPTQTDPVSILGSGRSPGGGNGNSLQYFCLENPMDRGSPAGYNPWGRKELDPTKCLRTWDTGLVTSCTYTWPSGDGGQGKYQLGVRDRKKEMVGVSVPDGCVCR